MAETLSATVTESIMPWQDMRVKSNYRRRLLFDKIMKVLAIVAVVVVLFPLLDMLYLFAYKGLSVLSISMLTKTTLAGGLSNAIVGSGLLVGLSAFIAVPLGIFSGVYLAEFTSTHNKFAEAIRFVADVLAGVPSIVLGYVGFLTFVLYFHWGYSAMASAVTLSILMLPYIIRTTELSIRRVPDSIREGAIALGSTKSSMINRLTLKFALPGIITGVMLAVSISFSETAPLLYTADFNDYLPTALFHQPVGFLTYIVYVYSNLAGTANKNLAYSASFVLLSFVFMVNFVARVVLKRFSKI